MSKCETKYRLGAALPVTPSDQARDFVGGRRRCINIVLWTCLLFAPISQTWAQCKSSDWECQSLEGIPGVFLSVISGVPGLEAENVQNHVELKLRSAGIRIFADADKSNENLRDLVPYLTVTLTAAVPKPELDVTVVAIHSEIEFLQVVSLATARRIVAPTWSKSKLGVFGRLATRSAGDEVVDLVSQFANDFLTANPK